MARKKRTYSDQEITAIKDRLPQLIFDNRGNWTVIAETLGLPRQALVGLVAKRPELQDARQEGDERLADAIEAQLCTVALDPKEWRGINVTSQIFALKALRGARWNPPNKVELDDSGYRQPDEEERERDTGARLTVVNGTRGGDDGG